MELTEEQKRSIEYAAKEVARAVDAVDAKNCRMIVYVNDNDWTITCKREDHGITFE